MELARPFAAWLDKNCDFKRHYVGPTVGPVPRPELGEPYECDHWYFVIDDHDDGETPGIVVKVGHEERSDYMGVEIENWNDFGEPDGWCFLGLFRDTEDLETVLKVLTRVNRR